MRIYPLTTSLLVYFFGVLFEESAHGWAVPRFVASSRRRSIDKPRLLWKPTKENRDHIRQNHVGSCSMTETSTVAETNNKKMTKDIPNRATLLKASSAGLAVSLAMVPEAIAFSFVAGVSPLVGLWTTVVLGFTAAALGGRAGICSSASGACSVVVAALCASHGPAYLSACAIMAGLLQIVGGMLGVGKFVKLVSVPVMLGFVNGLALVMMKAQLVHFQTVAGNFLSLTSPLGSATYGVAAFTMILVQLLPKITKVIPPTLGAVSIASIVAKILSLPAKTLADVAGASTFAGGFAVLPKIGLPLVPFSVETLKVVFPYAAIMASVGILESLLTMQLLDNMADDGRRGSTTRECLGQGTGNVLAGLTGGFGGCALLGQSIINMQSGGGISRWSGMSMALFLALGIVLGAPLLANVPVASLVGVMLLVCYTTFSWSSLRLINKIPKLDAFVIALVSIVTVQKDLAIAVLAGMIVNSLGFAYQQTKAISMSTTSSDTKQKIYTLRGTLYFGSTQTFDSFFTPRDDPPTVILDLSDCPLKDHSAIHALEELTKKYTELGKAISIQGISQEGDEMLQRYLKDRKYPDLESISTTTVSSSTTGNSSPLYRGVPLPVA